MTSRQRWWTIFAAATAVMFAWAAMYALRLLDPPKPKAVMAALMGIESAQGWWLVAIRYVYGPLLLKGALAGALALGLTVLIRPFRQLDIRVVAVATLVGLLLLDVALITHNVLILRGLALSTFQQTMPSLLQVVAIGLLGKAFGLLVIVVLVRRFLAPASPGLR